MLPIKMPDFVNVVAAGTALLEKIPLGPTYRRLILELGGTAFTKAMITRILIKLNTKPIWDITGSDLDTINKYRGLYDEATHLTLDFSEPRARTIIGQEWGNIDTSKEAGITSFSVEVTIAGATAPTLKAWAETGSPQPLDSPYKGLITAMLSQPYNAAAGSFTVPLPKGSDVGALIKRTYIFAANLTKANVKRNGVNVFEEIEPAVNSFMQKEYQRAPQANLFVIDNIIDGNQSGSMPTRDANLEMRLTFSGAEVARLYGDLYIPLAAV